MRKLALFVAAVVLVGMYGSNDDDDDARASDVPDPAAAATAPESSAPAARAPKSPAEPDAEPATAGNKESRSKRVSRRSETKPEPSRKPEPRRRLYPVLDVVDGDTVKVGYRGGVSVRVIGIDTPETVHPSQPDECWGEAASSAGKRLLTGRQVALVFDPTQGRSDAYGRTLAYLEVPGLGDYGLVMLRRGHAAEYTYDTAYQRQARYRAAQGMAKAAGTAMWGRCGGPDVPVAEPTPEPQPQASGSCAAGYDPCVPPFPPDVDCADVDGPVRVTGDDPHGLDRDGDGVACES